MTPAPTSDLNRIRQMMWDAGKAGRLAMWTVYDHPADYPDKFVARLHEVGKGGTVATASIIIAPDLETLRNILCYELHLTFLARDPADAPVIVETWI